MTTDTQEEAQAAPAPEPVPVPEVDKRVRLLTEYEIEWNRQVEWRIYARRYAVQMLDSQPVRENNSPCGGGTDEWLRRQGVPALHYAGRYGIGDETDARRRASEHLANYHPVRPTASDLAGLERQLAELRKAGVNWREVFIRTLKIKYNAYPHMPQDLVNGLIEQLNAPAQPIDLAAIAQGAPFPGSTAQVLAEPTTACVTLTIQIPLELTGYFLSLSDTELQNNVAESLRNTLQRSIRQKAAVRIADPGIGILSTVTRR